MRLPRARLTAKIALLIVVVLILGFGASTVLTIQRESTILIEENKTAARRLVTTLVAGIETAMLQERPDIIRGLIQDLRSASPVEGLTVFRRNGAEAFTDLETLRQVSKEAELSKEVVEAIQRMQTGPGRTISGPLFTRAVETLHPQEVLEQRDGATYFTLYQPIPNRDKCQGCHGRDHKVRAVIHVSTSMEPILAQVRAQRTRQILIGVLTILVAAAVLAVAMRQVVVRPIHELSLVAQRIGEGDFAARAPTASGDEVAELGAALNDMTAHLARSQHELAARNQELAQALDNLQATRARVELLEQLRGELSKFVPDAVKNLLERDPTATRLEKRTEEVSVLFLDIAGYTRLSEQLDPRRLNQLVQTYFSSFLEIIRGHHGDVNETAGDGLMVIFQRSGREKAGPEQDDALNAARAALAIQQKTAELAEEYAGMFPAIALHMGINTGQALVGATKIGGPGSERWTFTATGPTTNVAARLAASAQGGEIVVGPVTAERVRSRFVLEALGEKTFKNVSQPLAVYRLVPPGVYSRVS